MPAAADRALRIGLVNQPWNDAIPPVRAGSIAIWNYQVARRLAREHQPIIVARARRDAPIREIVEGIAYARVGRPGDAPIARQVRRALAMIGLGPSFASSRYFLPYARGCAKVAQNHLCDLVHVHNLSQTVPVVRRFNREAAIALHMHCEWLTQLDHATIATRLAHADVIIGCSAYITRRIAAAFPVAAHRCHTVYNGVDPEEFRPQPWVTRRDERTILFVGRISPEKGLHVLLPAFAEIARQYADVRLVIAGPDAPTPRDFIVDAAAGGLARLRRWYDVDYPDAIRRMVPEALRNRISFTGPIAHDELPTLYAAADIVVNPSLSESFGMSLIEAMACGRPVVATRVGGMPEVVCDGDTGHLVEPGDPRTLAAACLALLDDGTRRYAMGTAGRRRAEQLFSWERITARLLDVYREALAAKATCPQPA